MSPACGSASTLRAGSWMLAAPFDPKRGRPPIAPNPLPPPPSQGAALLPPPPPPPHLEDVLEALQRDGDDAHIRNTQQVTQRLDAAHLFGCLGGWVGRGGGELRRARGAELSGLKRALAEGGAARDGRRVGVLKWGAATPKAAARGTGVVPAPSPPAPPLAPARARQSAPPSPPTWRSRWPCAGAVGCCQAWGGGQLRQQPSGLRCLCRRCRHCRRRWLPLGTLAPCGPAPWAAGRSARPQPSHHAASFLMSNSAFCRR